MGFTNTTSHYNLPQYVATDKPKYLTDFNQTMEAIDTQMYTNAQAAATADGKAVAAKDTADGAVSSIGTLNTQINGDVSDPSDRGLAGDVSDNSGAINTINSLIGNGTPTTTDKTIIGAINEIYADITGGGTDVTADNVSYDNTTSGLTATDVQAAIDEVNGKLDGYVYDSDVVVTSHYDGVKTVKQLLEEAYASVVSMIQASDDKFIFVSASAVATLCGPLVEAVFDKNSTNFKQAFKNIIMPADLSVCNIVSLSLDVNSSMTKWALTTSGNTASDMASGVAGSDVVVTLRKYKAL